MNEEQNLFRYGGDWKKARPTGTGSWDEHTFRWEYINPIVYSSKVVVGDYYENPAQYTSYSGLSWKYTTTLEKLFPTNHGYNDTFKLSGKIQFPLADGTYGPVEDFEINLSESSTMADKSGNRRVVPSSGARVSYWSGDYLLGRPTTYENLRWQVAYGIPIQNTRAIFDNF